MVQTLSRSRTMRTALLVFGSLVALALAANPAGATSPPSSPVIDDWYQVTTDTVAAAAISAQSSNSRIWALSWTAANDALRHKRHRGHRHGHHRHAHGGLDGRAADAAVATAVHDVLVALVPARTPQLDASLATTLGAIPDGKAEERGKKRGAKAAAAVLAERSSDGLDFASVNQPFTPGAPAIGLWQFTPPFGAPVQAGLPNAKPFFLGKANRFRPAAAPGPGDAAYRASYNEIKELGSSTSATRTPAQTDLARWIAQSSLNQYTQALKAVLAAKAHAPRAWKTSLVAAFHTITADAQIAVFEAKYHYLRWRPITAIRGGDSDGDPQTAGDAAWTPLLNPPQHPEYPSGHLTYAGAAQVVLTEFLGPHAPAPFTATAPTAPGVTQTYGANAWKQLVIDNDNGRVWSGIHFRFSDKIGAELGRKVASYDLAKSAGEFTGVNSHR